MLLVRSLGKYSTQPRLGNVYIDWDNPLLSKLEFLMVGGVIYFKPSIVSVSGQLSNSITHQGVGVVASSSTSIYYSLPSSSGGTNDWTIAGIFMPLAIPTTISPSYGGIAGYANDLNSGIYDRQLVCRFDSAPAKWSGYMYTGSAVNLDSIDTTLAVGKTDIVSLTSGSNLFAINVNGLDNSTSVASNGYNGYSAAKFIIGDCSVTPTNPTVAIPLLLKLNSRLTPELRMSFANNPWQIFKKSRSFIYFDAPTTSLTAALNSDLSGQATLTGALSQTIGLTSALSSVSTLNNSLTSSISLASNMVGVSAFSGSLANTSSLTTSLQSTATLSTNAPTLSTSLSSALSAQSTFSGAVTQAQQLTSNFQSVATLTSATTSAMLLSSAQVANASLASNLTASTPGGLSSDFFAIATLTGALTTTQALSSNFVGVSTVTSSVTTALALQSTFSATATINSAITSAMVISSSLNGLASLDSNLTAITSTGLLTSLAAQATFSGQLSLTQSLSSNLAAQSAFLSVLSSSSDYAIPNSTYTLTSKTVKYKLRRFYVH